MEDLMRFSMRMLMAPVVGGMAVFLAACGGSDSGSPAPTPPPAATPEPAEAMPAEPVAEEAAPAAETPEPVEAAAPAEPAATGYAAYTGDPVKGKRIFAQCMTCHAVQEGRNNVGPSLYQIVGRESGTIPGFKYSAANAGSDVIWTEENLFEYLENPQAYIPGTIMAFPGLRNPQDRADVIAYLKNPT